MPASSSQRSTSPRTQFEADEPPARIRQLRITSKMACPAESRTRNQALSQPRNERLTRSTQPHRTRWRAGTIVINGLDANTTNNIESNLIDSNDCLLHLLPPYNYLNVGNALDRQRAGTRESNAPCIHPRRWTTRGKGCRGGGWDGNERY